ncbi:glycosyltransferase [Cyanobium sp. Morenito 9A2]|uniref:glycosyltransferase n=1 Tax=Cyanobium sp. Morenito 9A2 TaxID=2823718 RepID=UPI0020CF636E|nr:glycosyltransferase [Cyanobium sp. Morenito 9A2]MCP9849790.1 hypothetical protein [Cyanobium sp. Morenito 9A2]
MRPPLRILLVSPRFPPSSAADSQRLRMLLPHFSSAGVQADVLAVDPACSANPLDPWQAEHLPPEVPVHRVRGRSLRWARIPGLGNLEARSFGALARTGSRLLSSRRFDLVYISTTAFGSFGLGPLWKRRHGVPFVLDLQDPWVNDYYRQHPAVRPPGGRLKYALADRLHRRQEPRVLRQCSGLTSVSAAYVQQTVARWPWAASIPAVTLPFPGSAEDFEHLGAIAPSQLPFDPADGLLHWVSIGRGGADLTTALEGLFSALARHAPAELQARLRLHFLGTSYAPAGRGIPSIAPIAARFGLTDLVEESTDRLPLSLTLATLRAADALLVIGSDDPGYTASKLYPCLLARQPLLALMHPQSSVVELIRRCGGGVVVPLAPGESSEVSGDRIAAAWLAGDRYGQTQPLEAAAFGPHTAAAQARTLAAFLHACLDQPSDRSPLPASAV